MKIRKKKKFDWELSSGNVFADLGLPNPEELLAEADQASQINDLLKKKKLTQVEADKLLGELKLFHFKKRK